jgi:hypothetical protein
LPGVGDPAKGASGQCLQPSAGSWRRRIQTHCPHPYAFTVNRHSLGVAGSDDNAQNSLENNLSPLSARNFWAAPFMLRPCASR